MSFIAGYLTGLSEQTASGGNNVVQDKRFKAIDMLPALSSLPVYDGWEVRQKISGDAEENRHYAYAHFSNGVCLPIAKIKTRKLYNCVYKDNVMMYGYMSPLGINEYEYRYNDPDDYYLKYNREYIITDFSAVIRFFEIGFSMVDYTYDVIFRETNYEKDGSFTVSDTERRGSGCTTAFGTSNIGVAEGHDIYDLTFLFYEACHKRYLYEQGLLTE